MKKIERKEAKSQGLKRYYTGRPCKSGHTDERYTTNGRCLSCMRNWEEENRGTVLAQKSEWVNKNKEYWKNHYSENKEKVISRVKKYRLKNTDKVKETQRKYYLRNRDNLVEKSKVNSRLYNKKYPWVALARTRAYQAAKAKRAISLSDSHRSDILHIYQQCALLRHLGYDYHVDHIIPLRGKTVSGLHVPWNLQVIPASQNMSKGNKIAYEYLTG